MFQRTLEVLQNIKGLCFWLKSAALVLRFKVSGEYNDADELLKMRDSLMLFLEQFYPLNKYGGACLVLLEGLLVLLMISCVFCMMV